MYLAEKPVSANIVSIIPFSNVDGPGNRFAIFFSGCNLECIYCHNPHTINICNDCGECVTSCNHDALRILDSKVIYDKDKCVNCDLCIENCKRKSTPKSQRMSTEDVFKQIKAYKNYIRGITFSGGEPTLNPEFIIELSKAVKSIGLNVLVDTNSNFDFENSMELINNVDGFMMDIKGSLGEYNFFGIENYYGIRNLEKLIGMNKVAEVRTIIMQDLGEKTVIEVSKLLAGTNILYRLIPMHITGTSNYNQQELNKRLPSTDYLEKLKNIAISLGIKNVAIK
jgi:pyruvate formate lyase activating enzyme